MATILQLGCHCGAVKGTVEVVKGNFFHVQCLCCDCQRFAKNLACEAKILDTHGATEILQTYPCYMQLNAGHENVACMQLSEQGSYRWHTRCCNMPLGNTLKSAKVPFVGIPVPLIQFANEQEKGQVLGPIQVKVFGKYARGDMPPDAHAKFPLAFMPKMLGFLLKGFLRGKASPSPFFKQGRPMATPERPLPG